MLVIASSFRKEYDSKTNLSLFIDSYHFLSSLSLRPSIGIGSYDGEEELSFSFEISPFAGATFKEISKHFLEERGQECILVRRGEKSNYCYLLYSDSERAEQFIGEWREVSKDFALAQENYSCFNGSYYVVA